MKPVYSLLAGLLFLSGMTCASELDNARAHPLKRNKAGEEQLGWELGLQLWTFGAYTLPEQLEIAKSLDVDFIEFGPGVKFSQEEKPNLLSLTADQEKRLKALLDQHDIQPKQLYVHVPNSEEQWTKWFEFAKAWEIDLLVAEPKPEHYEFLEKLCKEYDVRVGVHNHPNENNRYWNPDMVVAQIADRNALIGFNPDLGHWMRMGVDPVEQLRRPEVGKRIVGMHLNDVQALGVNKSPHVVVGTGAGQTAEMLKLLKEQGYKGRFTIEYGNWKKNLDDVRGMIRFFDDTAAALNQG